MKNMYRFLLPVLLVAFVAIARAEDEGESEGKGNGKNNTSELMVTVAGGEGAFKSTLRDVNVQNFSDMSAGVYKNVEWDGVGKIDQLSLIKDNQYGGTPSTSVYPVQSEAKLGGNAAVPMTTLSLKSSMSYFGLYWSAGDGGNVLDFYNGKSLVAHFTTESLLSYLPKSYNGNPDPSFKGQDAGEKFAFINFFAADGTSFDKIVFSNLGGSGFESQNWTTREAAYNPAEDGAISGTPLIDVKTIDGLTTQSKIDSLNYDGKNLYVSTEDGGKNIFASSEGGASFSASSYNAAPLAGIRNPEPSVYLTFGMMSVLLLMAARRKAATA